MLYVRPLTEDEQSQVDRLARSPDTVTYRRAQIVRLSARQNSVGSIASTLNVSDRTVRNTLHAFNEHGVSALPRKKSPGRRCSLTPEQREKLVEVLHPSPTCFGIESVLWTAPDLARIASEKGLCGPLHPDTVRAEVRKAGHSWKRAKRWTTSPDPAYEQKKGGSPG